MARDRYFIAVDCEGVACAVGKPGGTLNDSANYAFVQKQATREADAAARALFDAGASQVIVCDGHSSGINLSYDLLDPRCDIMLGSGYPERFPTMDERVAGLLFIGFHSRENTKTGTLAHSYSSETYQWIKVNGVEVGEMEIDAAIAGRYGVPVIFAASDDITVSQAQAAFPWAQTVTTKRSLGWTSALCKHPARVCDEIYAGVTRAVARLSDMQLFGFEEPLCAEFRYKRMDAAAAALHVDMHGEPFAQPDPFTRAGTIASILRLF
ncbi:MAG: M55 family metallopeptidase [Clostridiales bacterium]|nr:M55 family metallopeptidase [Clostridiales bacterium]